MRSNLDWLPDKIQLHLVIIFVTHDFVLFSLEPWYDTVCNKLTRSCRPRGINSLMTAKTKSPTVVIIKEQSAALTRAIFYCSHSII